MNKLQFSIKILQFIKKPLTEQLKKQESFKQQRSNKKSLQYKKNVQLMKEKISKIDITKIQKLNMPEFKKAIEKAEQLSDNSAYYR